MNITLNHLDLPLFEYVKYLSVPSEIPSENK